MPKLNPVSEARVTAKIKRVQCLLHIVKPGSYIMSLLQILGLASLIGLRLATTRCIVKRSLPEPLLYVDKVGLSLLL